MPHLLINHTVEDDETWKPYFDDHGTTREESGGRGGQLFYKEDELNEIASLLECDSLGNAHEFAASDDLRETMEEADVVGEPDLVFLEKIEDVPK